MEPLHYEYRRLYSDTVEAAQNSGYSPDVASLFGELAILWNRPDLSREQVMPFIMTGDPDRELTAAREIA
jgi:hypothetical protein